MNQTMPTMDNNFQTPERGKARKWLEDNASESRKFLLAFADDGVIWGKYQNGLKTSSTLEDETLQQAFLFGDMEELRLFQGEDGNWKACLITDTNVAKEDRVDEIQLLWGSEALEEQNVAGFTRVRDRIQKTLEHVLPLELSKVNLDQESPRLQVRHYLQYDASTGEARIFLSRLVHLGTGPIAEEKFNEQG